MHANAITHACPAACCHALVRPHATHAALPAAPGLCTARSPLPSLCPRLSLSLFCSLCSRHGLAKLWFELGRRCFHYSASLHARPSAPSPPSCSLPCLHMLAGAALLGAAAAPAQAAAARTRGQSAASCFDIGGAHPRVLFGRRCHAARPHQPLRPAVLPPQLPPPLPICPLPPSEPRHFEDEIRDVRSLVPQFSAPAAC
jgi:hypothetical protein